LLINAGVTWLSLQWTKPSGTPSDEGISYILEMEDENSVSLEYLFSIRKETIMCVFDTLLYEV